MRVLLVHRYFAPDTPPYAHLLPELAVALGDAGHQVQVLTCQPSYNREVAGEAPSREQLAPRVTVRRWPVLPDRNSSLLKLANLVWFCLRLVAAFGEFRRADIVMAASTPPIGVAKVAGTLARLGGARFVYHKQDIYPEVALAAGMMRPGAFASLLRRLDARTDRSADRVVVLCEDMADTITDRGVDPHRIAVINNFDPWQVEESPVESAAPRTGDGPLNVVFAGNLGRFQNLETLFAAIAELADDPRFVFHFFGAGALAGQLTERVAREGLTTVRMYGYRSPEVVATFLRDHADLGIVSLVPGVAKAAYPSKTMSYLRHGCPIFAMIESDTELARDVTLAGAGMCADPSDPAAVAEALRSIVADPTKLQEARGRAQELYRQRFDRTRQLVRWLELFDPRETA